MNRQAQANVSTRHLDEREQDLLFKPVAAIVASILKR